MDMSYAQHFGSNYVPSKVEVTEIRGIIREKDAERTRLDGKISRVQDILSGLMHDWDKVNNTINAHEALISPARRIPPEMLAEIFQYCVPDRGLSSNMSDTPWVVAQVCATWRQVALSTPALWSSIYIRGTTDEMTIDFPFVRTSLSRSGVLPLSITLHHDTSLKNPSPSPLLEILDTIVAHSSRWRNLRLVLPAYGIQRMLNNPEVPVPSLESLDLVISNKLKEDDRFTISNTATRLRTLHLSSSHLNARFFNLAWPSLTHFSAASALTFDDCHDIFRQSANLQLCSLRCIRDCPDFQPHPEALIVVPQLRSFELHPHGDVGPLLDVLVLPSLRIMHIEFRDWDIPRLWPKSRVLALLSRSSCSIERLILAGKMISEDDLVECVERVPSLRDLVVTFREEESLLTDRVRAMLDGRRSDDQMIELEEKMPTLACASGSHLSRSMASGITCRKRCRMWDSMLVPGNSHPTSSIQLAS